MEEARRTLPGFFKQGMKKNRMTSSPYTRPVTEM
jgi:hypothetical protein